MLFLERPLISLSLETPMYKFPPSLQFRNRIIVSSKSSVNFILKLDLVSVWSVIAIQEFIKAIIFYKRFNSEKWKDIRVINNIDRGRIS